MTLVIHELTSNLDQVITTPDRDIIVEAIRPHIYRHRFPTGSLKIQIYDSLNALVSESEVIQISDIGTLGFFHGYVRFYINAYLAKNSSYKIRLVSQGGYTFDESAYCAWVNGYDLAKYQPSLPLPDGISFPLDYEIWELKVK